jgi:hypothetical protein
MRHFLSILSILFTLTLHAQAPQGIPYQAVARTAQGDPVVNAPVQVRFSLREQTASGTISYQEAQSPTTNDLGLFAASFGTGTASVGTFSGINWAQTVKFLQVEIDLGQGWVDMGAQQLMSVPYALYAGSSINCLPGGATNGQILTSCDGSLLWTDNGICPQSATNLTVGAPYGGGVIVHIFLPGEPGYVQGEVHGVIAATEDLNIPTPWGCFGTLIGDTKTGNGFSEINNSLIITICIESNIAARIAYDYIANNYSDWVLPSKDELRKIYTNLYPLDPSSFISSEPYWSSSENTQNTAWGLFFGDGTDQAYLKWLERRVRLVRYF